MNKNVEYTHQQIVNTLDALVSQGVIKYTIPCEVTDNKEDSLTQVSWKNHIGGRSVSGKAFNMVKQYMAILSSLAYQAIMVDYSIVRASFVFEQGKLRSQNLLWWPCPVQVDERLEQELGLIECMRELLQESSLEQHLIMRTPVRVDFDSRNDNPEHPRAHTHIQHHECRIAHGEPICFNRFMRFILENHYPYLTVDYRGWNYLNYQYDNKNNHIIYLGHTQLVYK